MTSNEAVEKLLEGSHISFFWGLLTHPTLWIVEYRAF